MSNAGVRRRTQAERREETKQAVLESACLLFGGQGYAGTSLDQIASDCGLTIRPIYHYFGNKKALFAAVNEVMEERIVASMNIGTTTEPGAGILANWRAFLNLCDDPAFRRIVLLDSPNILSRERWLTSVVSEKARLALGYRQDLSPVEQYRLAMFNRVVMGAFTEAAPMIAESEDIDLAHREAERLMAALFSGRRDKLGLEQVQSK